MGERAGVRQAEGAEGWGWHKGCGGGDLWGVVDGELRRCGADRPPGVPGVDPAQEVLPLADVVRRVVARVAGTVNPHTHPDTLATPPKMGVGVSVGAYVYPWCLPGYPCFGPLTVEVPNPRSRRGSTRCCCLWRHRWSPEQ